MQGSLGCSGNVEHTGLQPSSTQGVQVPATNLTPVDANLWSSPG